MMAATGGLAVIPAAIVVGKTVAAIYGRVAWGAAKIVRTCRKSNLRMVVVRAAARKHDVSIAPRLV